MHHEEISTVEPTLIIGSTLSLREQCPDFVQHTFSDQPLLSSSFKALVMCSHRFFALPLLLLAACGGEPNGSMIAGRFSASLSGAVAATYEGAGEFHTGTPGPGMQQFQITSSGTQSFAGQEFTLTRWDGGRLRPGRHDITLVDLSEYMRGSTRQPRGITFQYFRVVDGRQELYVADSGSLEITSSSDDKVAGRFTISAFRYCLRETAGLKDLDACDIAAPAAAGAPRVTVTGSFAATPFDTESVIAM